MNRLLSVLFLAALCGPLVAAEGPAGFWSGAIQVPQNPLEVMVELEQRDGAWHAAVYIPSQGVRGAEMKNVSVDGAAVGFAIPQVPGDPTFAGNLAGDTLSGTFTQGGQSIPFELTRGEKPAELSVDIYAEFRNDPLPGDGLAGSWKSLLDAGPHRYRLVLEVEQGEAGLTATLRNLDRGPDTPQPIQQVSLEGRSVTLDIGGGATFEGTLNDDGSQVEGTFKQGPAELPMTLWRAG